MSPKTLMKIRAGFTLGYECMQPTPMLLTLNIHPSRRIDLLTDQVLTFTQSDRGWGYIDGFGNACTRIVAPPGITTISTAFEIYDSGRARRRGPKMRSSTTSRIYLTMFSCSCSAAAIVTPIGSVTLHGRSSAIRHWAGARVQVICDFVHNISSSTIRMPIRSGRPMVVTAIEPAFAVTSRISRSRSAAA